MTSGPTWRKRMCKGLMILGTGSLLLQPGADCDPTVQTTVLGGFQQLSTTLVTAVFQAIAADMAEDNGTPLTQ